jgi:type I restriction enzyme S subunit
MSRREKNKVPQVRFHGFAGDWEEKTIGSILSEVKRSVVLIDNLQYELITVKRRNEGIVSRGYLFGREILVKNYSQLKTGDFVVSKRQVVHGATGVVPVQLNNAIASNEYLVAAESKDISTGFLTLLACLPEMKRKFFLSSYGVDIEKLFFDANDWKKRTLIIPGKCEQEKIVSYFKDLDQMIQLHQHKHDKLVILKKAMLQKMFPQHGSTTPKIRFKEFSGDWEVDKLGALGEFNPKALLPEVFEYVDLESVVGTRMVGHRTLLKSMAPSRAQRVAKKGDLFFQTVRPYQRNNYLFALKDKNYVFSTGYAQIRPLNDGDFLLALVQRDEFVKIVMDNCTGTGYPAINANILSMIAVCFPPSVEEQKKIGHYFRQLDALISQHAIQMEKIKQVKAACLEKMFV